MHKKIGIIGGLSPESTVSYYLHITRTYVERYGDYGYPDIIIYSVNLEKYHRWRSENRWDLVAEDLIASAKSLQRAGADFGLIATNTMHKIFNIVQDEVSLPLIHLIDVTAEKAKEMGLKKLGLLGTQYTMSDGFAVCQSSCRMNVKFIVSSIEPIYAAIRVSSSDLPFGGFSQT